MPSVAWRLIPVLVLQPVSLVAQASLDSVARRLKPGQTVRLHSQTGHRVEGRFAAYQPDPSVMQLTVRDTTLSFAEIDSIWVRRSGAKTGAIVGAVGVGVPSAILWSSLCNGLSDTSDCAQGVVVGLTVAGAAVGALLGAAIGSATSHWQVRYASPRIALKVTPLPAQRFGVGFSMRLPAVIR